MSDDKPHATDKRDAFGNLFNGAIESARKQTADVLRGKVIDLLESEGAKAALKHNIDRELLMVYLIQKVKDI